ncbi:MAG TPA: RHS repeat-associated core domain-containing protein [Steroidobacteraceae bacterium]|nr:RHS repeat-associated core domain-containing protein [Steroidobacteraceae bacterium]
MTIRIQFILALVALLLSLSAEARFLQTDPIGTKDDLNLYLYANSDPVDFTDPDGEGALFNGFRADPQNTRYQSTNKVAVAAERNLYATAQSVNASQANFAFLHGDSRGLYVNMEFGHPLASTPISNALRADANFDRRQMTIVSACNAASTNAGANIAKETGTTTLAANGFVFHDRSWLGSVSLSVSSSRDVNNQDRSFVEYSSSGHVTGRTFTSISIGSDGAISLSGERTETPTGSRIARTVKFTCDSKGVCKDQ